jgi:hypothetical protein
VGRRRTNLPPRSFNELLALLVEARERLLNELADAIARNPGPPDSVRTDVPGGFGVEVTNRRGSVVEVGEGADAWFLFRHRPPPGRCYSDRPAVTGTRVFFLDGGHHTELGPDMLVSRAECLRVLREWLDSGTFPERK